MQARINQISGDVAQLGEPEEEIHPVNEFPGERPCSGCTGWFLSKADKSRHGWQAIISNRGDVAQLGERRVRNAKVGSSILLVSTKYNKSPGSSVGKPD